MPAYQVKILTLLLEHKTLKQLVSSRVSLPLLINVAIKYFDGILGFFFFFLIFVSYYCFGYLGFKKWFGSHVLFSLQCKASTGGHQSCCSYCKGPKEGK